MLVQTRVPRVVWLRLKAQARDEATTMAGLMRRILVASPTSTANLANRVMALESRVLALESRPRNLSRTG